MSTIDQIIYRARDSSADVVMPVATSLRDQEGSYRWLRRLHPCLRSSKARSCAYLNLGSQAAFIRSCADATSRFTWQYALVLVGESATLTGSYALEVPPPDLETLRAGGELRPVVRTERGPGHSAIEARARSADAIRVLVPLLAHALRGERRVNIPWTEWSLPEAVMWGLISILEMAGIPGPVSFLTRASASSADPDTPGLLVSFRSDNRTVLPPDPGFEALAAGLAARFADGPDELRQTLAQHGLLEPADSASRITRLLDLWPRIQTGAVATGGTASVNVNSDRPASRPASAAEGSHGRSDTPDPVVICPICLHEIQDWDIQGYWQWDDPEEKYKELVVPAGLNEMQMVPYLRGAHIRCPAPLEAGSAHYLPVNYGRFGRPVLLGFVGLTKSGKSHLLASMAGAIERGDLEKYGISSRPIDHAKHQQFLEKSVNPLFRHSKVLDGTQEGIVEFADAFIMRHDGGPERPVALFDVAGEDLARVKETKRFLLIADGLFFVIDPDNLVAGRVGDETFSNVLDVVQQVGDRPGPLNAAIILNKADKVRFDDPVARWLRSPEPDDGELDAVEFLRESADVYGYLHTRRAAALTRPYQVCDKGTLHVASPTGGVGEGEGGVYPRGVAPRGVLRPLLAMLAMTGVLTGPEAEKVGL
jgi:hypothetical protein